MNRQLLLEYADILAGMPEHQWTQQQYANVELNKFCFSGYLLFKKYGARALVELEDTSSKYEVLEDKLELDEEVINRLIDINDGMSYDELAFEDRKQDAFSYLNAVANEGIDY